MFNMYFQFFGLFDIILIAIVYFTRSTYKSEENKIYSFLIIMSIIGQVLHIGSYITIYNMESIPFINTIVTKLYLVYLAIWVSAFFLYICAVTYKLIKKKNYLINLKKISTLVLLLDVILLMLIIILPTNCYRENSIVYTYGSSVTLIYIVSILYILVSLSLFIKHIKEIRKIGLKKYIPLFIFVLVGTAVMIIQFSNPSLLLITSCETFITFLMYFTIENPDLKMLNEFHKAREYAENSNNEKATFLFNIAGQVKAPVKNINMISKEMLMNDDITEIKEGLNQIKYSSNNLLDIVNKVLDISDTEKRNISIRSKEYHAYNLFKSLVASTQINLKDKNIDFRTSYDKSIPEKLYGDSIRIKQIITTLLDNSIKYTKEGFIEFNINSVVKYDICRLIIVIEDSGVGIDSEKLETIFNKDKLYTNKELNNLDDTKMNLGMVKALVDLIGGTIMINSELGKWTKITVVLDQKVVTDNKNTIIKEVEKYEDLYINKDTILVVVHDKKIEKTFISKLKKYPINVDIVTNGEDCIEKIKSKQKYKLIMMVKNLEKLSCEDTYNKLKMLSNFKTPVALFLNDADISTIKEYQRQGFDEVELLPIKDGQIEAIIEKYNLDGNK